MKLLIFLILISTSIFAQSKASWIVGGFSADSTKLISRSATATYTGQSITEANLKTATRTAFDVTLTYTGVVEGDYIGIAPIQVFDEEIVWIVISRRVVINLETE